MRSFFSKSLPPSSFFRPPSLVSVISSNNEPIEYDVDVTRMEKEEEEEGGK